MNISKVVINDKGFYIREIKLTDADRYQKLLLHPEVKPFIPKQLLPNSTFDTIRTITALKALSSTKSGAYWAICDASDNLIGSAGFESWNHFHKRLEVAFELHPDYQGQGIMTQALNQIIKIGFDDMDAIRIEAFTLLHNKPSIKLLERIGFTREAELKKYRMFNDKIHNIYLFALTK
jgi:ribosomal-protein-alanine N-acetyltransferase